MTKNKEFDPETGEFPLSTKMIRVFADTSVPPENMHLTSEIQTYIEQEMRDLAYRVLNRYEGKIKITRVTIF